MSGDMNTALGNCLIMSSLYYGLNKLSGVQFEVADDGDDCVIICERRNLRKLTELIPPHFLAAGFTMEVGGAVDIFEQIKFCQCQPVWNGVCYTMVRNPTKALSTDLCGTGRWVDDDVRRGIISLVGYGGGHLCTGIPVMQAFYQLLRHGAPINEREFDDSGFGRMVMGYLHDKKRKVTDDPLLRPITPRSRVSFYLAFGILPDLQRALEHANLRPKLGPLDELQMQKAHRKCRVEISYLKDRVDPPLYHAFN